MKPLGEFLTARLGEQQEDVERRGTYAVGHAERCIFEGGYEGTSSCDCGAVDRALADVAAKRTIVECLSATAPPMHSPRARVAGWHLEHMWEIAREGTLAYLALPYADHPDYDPAWRP